MNPSSIEVRDFSRLIGNTFSQIEAANISESEKTNLRAVLSKLKESLPKPPKQLLQNVASVISLLANSPDAYKTVSELIRFITAHFKYDY